MGQHRCGRIILNLAAATLGAVLPAPVWSHAAEQGFVLLLPTDLYTGAGVVTVALTLGLLLVVPRGWVMRLFRPSRLPLPRLARLRGATCWLSLVFLVALVALGLSGPRDPLANPLTLIVWAVFWIGLVSLQGLLGNLWSYLNPLVPLAGRGALRLPRGLGAWPAVFSFLAFGYVLLADPAPSDPARLARIAGLYWLSAAGLVLVFGRRWLVQGEVFNVILRLYARNALLHRGRIGPPGWRLTRGRMGLAGAVLAVFLLATGSFDGLNETFWWLGQLGLNPLEFPGRSAVVLQNTLGLLAANLLLLAVFAGVLRLGAGLAGQPRARITALLIAYAPTLLPIALGYHVAHYLPSFMVDGQYALVALSDPFLAGADYLRLGEFYVSTGFFNTQESVRRIYLTQAGAIVAGHVIAVLTAHAVALRQHASHRAALLSQAPLATFMVVYTWFGLWLLASPRF